MVEDMRAYNRSKLCEISVHDKTIVNMSLNGLKIRNRKTVDFVRGYFKSRFKGDVELEAGQLVRVIEMIGSLESSDTKKDNKVTRVTDVAEEFIRFFGEQRLRNENIIDTEKATEGFYVVVRKADNAQVDYFYEEPLFIGSFSKSSWLMSRRHGICWGFTLCSNGNFTVFLENHDRMRVVGFHIIMIHCGNFWNSEYLPGLMLRFSEAKVRPIVSTIAIRRILLEENQKADWKACEDTWFGRNKKKGEEKAKQLTHEVRKGDDRYELYNQLDIDNHIKCRDRQEWETICSRAGIMID